MPTTTEPVFKLDCPRCKEELYLNSDVKRKAVSCERKKCPCKQKTFRERVADLTQKDAGEFLPVLTGSVMVNPEPPKSSFQFPSARPADPWEGAGMCVMDTLRHCSGAHGYCCRDVGY